MDENLSYQDGEEPLKRTELIPLNEVDNRFVEEGVVVLSRPDVEAPPGKYEQDTKTKEKTKESEKKIKSELIYRKVLPGDLGTAKDLANRGTAGHTPTKTQVQGGARVVGQGANADPPPAAHTADKTKGADKDGLFPGDRLPPPGPSVSHGLPSSGFQMSGTMGNTNKNRIVRLHDSQDIVGVDYSAKEKGQGHFLPGIGGIGVSAGDSPREANNENENFRTETQPDLASRAAITFALMQTDDKTHTQFDEAAEENATRAAPFTMASQWGALGSSDEGSDRDASDDDGGGDKGKKSARSRRRATLNTLADEDDHQLDSMARNSLVLLDERDGQETMRASLVFEDESTDAVKLSKGVAVGDEEGPDDRLEMSSARLSDSSHHHSHQRPSTDMLYTSSPRKMPEKLAKDMDNRIGSGSPYKQNSAGSPSKFVFKNRESNEDRRSRKLVAMGKPPIHSSVKRERSMDNASSGVSCDAAGKQSSNQMAYTRENSSSLPNSKPKSILKDKNAMGERNSNVDNRFSSAILSVGNDVLVTPKDEVHSTPRDQSPRIGGSRHASNNSKSRDLEFNEHQSAQSHIRKYYRQGSTSASPRGYTDPRALAMTESDSSGVLPKPPPGHAPKNAVVTAR